MQNWFKVEIANIYIQIYQIIPLSPEKHDISEKKTFFDLTYHLNFSHQIYAFFFRLETFLPFLHLLRLLLLPDIISLVLSSNAVVVLGYYQVLQF